MRSCGISPSESVRSAEYARALACGLAPGVRESESLMAMSLRWGPGTGTVHITRLFAGAWSLKGFLGG